MPLKPYPIDYDAVRVGIIRAMQEGTGLDANHTVVAEPESPNWPRPTLPYMTLKIISPAINFGSDSLELVNAATETFNLGGPRQMAVSFQAYAATHEGANSLMALWQAALDAQPVLDILQAAGVAVWDVGSVTDLSLLLNAGYEGRANMDVQFGLASNLQVGVGIIQVAAVHGDVTREDGTVAVLDSTTP